MSKTPTVEILIATRNPGKIRELQDELRSLPLKLRLLEEFADVSPVAETGATYEENASLKALGYANQTGVWALADDSGLEVEALEGGPGLFSARFAGEHLSDKERTEKLIASLSPHSDSSRAALFVCSLALAGWQHGEEQTETTKARLLRVTQGTCNGLITTEPRGTNGFGFDPVFAPVGYHKTFAELPPEIKDSISHRAKALKAMRLFLSGRLAQLDPYSVHP